MSKIKWAVGPAKHRRGDDCEIVAILDNGMPVVKRSGSGSWYVHQENGMLDHVNKIETGWDLIPPRERQEGYLWVWAKDGAIYSAHQMKSEDDNFQNIPITVERNDAGDWELVK